MGCYNEFHFFIMRKELAFELIKRRTLKDLNNCWIWVGGKDKDGYGLTKFNRKTWRTHRLSYFDFYGALSKDLVIDHLCRNKACCNPTHLEEVTSKENVVIRGSISNATAKNYRKTHCKFGHEYIYPNYVVTKYGFRRCKVCEKRWMKNHRSKKIGTLTIDR